VKIIKITSQHRRDFTAIIECENCNETEKLVNGYDDNNYHRNVIPKMKCKACGKSSPDQHQVLTPKYAENVVV